METQTASYDHLIATTKTVDTTKNGGNGYPRDLQVAYTADTMGELRELYDAAIAAGHEATVVHLHRRDGWALWERTRNGSKHDLDDEEWMGVGEQDWTITITNASDSEQKAFEFICGTGYEVESAQDLLMKAKAVEALSKELGDGNDLEDDEKVLVFLDANNGGINYIVRTGQNGYQYDTHQYCTGIVVTEQEQ